MQNAVKYRQELRYSHGCDDLRLKKNKTALTNLKRFDIIRISEMQYIARPVLIIFHKKPIKNKASHIVIRCSIE